MSMLQRGEGEAMLHRAMVGRLAPDAFMRGWWSTLRSVTARSCGSLKATWIWLVKVPSMKQPAIGMAPEAAASFSTAHRPVFLLEAMTLTLARFSMVAIA